MTPQTATATRTASATPAQTPPQFPERISAGFVAQLPPALAREVASLGVLQAEGLRRFLGRRVSSGAGLRSTAGVLTALFLRLRSEAPTLVAVADLARSTGYGRPATYRALRYAAAPTVGRPKIERVSPRSTGPRRPGFWVLRAGIVPDLAELHAAGEAARVRQLRDQCITNANKEEKDQTSRPVAGPESPKTLSALLGAARPPLGTPARTADPLALLRWLDSPALDLDRVPSFTERAKMAAALRLGEDVDPEIADATLAALFWRRSAPLRVWRAAILALVSGAPDRFTRPSPPRRYPSGVVQVLSCEAPPEHWSKQPPRELEWRARLALRILVADPTAVAAFVAALELGTAPEDSEPAALARHIERIDAQLAAVVGAAARRDKCPLCEKWIKLGPLPTIDESRRLDDSFAFQVLHTIPSWQEAKTPGQKRKRTLFPRDNFKDFALSGPRLYVDRLGPHLCAVTLLTKRHFLRKELKEATS
jgi:hypothetical protein